MKKIILFLCVIIIVVSCESTNTSKCHKIITVVNKTNKTIYVERSEEYPSFDSYKNYPDPLNNSFTTRVIANESSQKVFPTYGNCYESIYANINSGVIMFYVFDGPTLEIQGWDYIKTNNLVLKRYDLTVQDLENMNWTITYDGN